MNTLILLLAVTCAMSLNLGDLFKEGTAKIFGAHSFNSLIGLNKLDSTVKQEGGSTYTIDHSMSFCGPFNRRREVHLTDSQTGRVFYCNDQCDGYWCDDNAISQWRNWIDSVIRKDFNKLDTDRNGIITKDEFRAWFFAKEGVKTLDNGRKNDLMELYFSMVDSKGDGVIDFEEFKAHY